MSAPVIADTESRLDSAKDRLAAVQQELDDATARYNEAYQRYQETTERISDKQREIAATRAEIAVIARALESRARMVYESGPGGTLEALLASGSFDELSDRLEFLGTISASDSSLVVDASVTREKLRRARSALSSAAEQQAAAAEALRREKQTLDTKFAEAQELVGDLTAQLREEQRQARQVSLYNSASTPAVVAAAVSGGSTPFALCPVGGPHSFIDSFGAPRSGGRTHEGIDLMAPRGVPVVAVQSGNAVPTPNSLGGNAVILYATNGDYTYYAHLDSYGASGSVTAGTTIGYVGNTGNASGGATHLHFEYHPGGGGAVNPYSYLLQVC